MGEGIGSQTSASFRFAAFLASAYAAALGPQASCLPLPQALHTGGFSSSGILGHSYSDGFIRSCYRSLKDH